MDQDDEQLKLLSVFHYVVGGMVAFFSLMPMIHLIFGIVILVSPETIAQQGQPPPAFLGGLLVGIASALILVGLTLAGAIIATGRFLSRRRHYMWCLIVGGIECIFMPIGTALGVFTIIVLMRQSVKNAFAEAEQGRWATASHRRR